MSSPDAADDQEQGRASVRLVRENQLLRIHATVSRLVAQQRDPELIRDEACRLLVEQGGFALAWIGLCEADGRITIASCHGEQCAYVAGLEIRWDDTPLGHGLTGTAVRERRAVAKAKNAKSVKFVSTMVVPCAFSLRTYSHSDRRSSTSTPAVGSSSKR